MLFFVKDFTETLRGRMFIFGIQILNGLLHHEIAYKPYPAYIWFLYLFDFHAVHTLNNYFLLKVSIQP